MSIWNEAVAEAKMAHDATLGAVVIGLNWDGLDYDDVAEFVAASPVTEVARECHRALLPGAHATLWVPGCVNDKAGLALRLAGFEIRDMVAVAHGDDISYWILARKRLAGSSVVENTLEHGTGGINIGATRVGAVRTPAARLGANGPSAGEILASVDGRFAPNVLLDSNAAAEMNRQAPSAGAGGPASGPTFVGASKSNSMAGHFNGMGGRSPAFHSDSGGAARFFPRVEDDGHGVFGLDWISDLVRTPSAPMLALTDESLRTLVSRNDYQTAL